MELKKFDTLVANIVEDVQSQVSTQITDLVKDQLKTRLDTYNYDLAVHKLTELLSTEDTEALQKRINAAVNVVVTNIQKQLESEIHGIIDKKISGINIDQQFSSALKSILGNKLTEVDFPAGSISASSVKQQDLVISGDQIHGGIIKGFSSTGIDDRASKCIVTLLDAAVVVENNLVTLDLTVEGNLNVKGTVDETSQFFKQISSSVTSNVKSGLNQDLFSNFSDVIFNTIKSDGLDLSKITVNGSTVIEGNRIGYSITESNLQRVGLLKELQVEGETQIAETLYVGNKRTGINTIEPSAALAVWDEEIEVTVSKLKDQTGRIGTPRNQSLVLSSNRQNNVVLHSDGTAQIDNLQVGQVKMTSSEAPPNYSSTKGHIVFNANPTPGGPLGWVCLGSANWANFGIID